MKFPNHLGLYVVFSIVFLFSGPILAQQEVLNIDTHDTPQLSRDEIGHFLWQLRIGNQTLMDFNNFEANNQGDLSAYRYSIAFSIYYLAIIQYHKLPAWTEAIQPTINHLIEKMLQKPVWQYWEKTSRGVPPLEPLMNKPYPSQRDPLAQKNIMFSGHLLHVINLYEMLYDDHHWDNPAAIKLKWDDKEIFQYDNHSLALAIFQQMNNSHHKAVSCEPNAIFPECNQHPVLGFILYDKMHQTSFSKVNQEFFDFFLEKGLIDPKTHETSMLYLEKQEKTLSEQQPFYYNLYDLIVAPAVKVGLATLESSTANGWTGLFMHAWQPEYIEEQYSYWQKKHLQFSKSGTATLQRENWEPTVSYGFFAALAAEMGDSKSKNGLLSYADQHYAPQWIRHSLHYPLDNNKSCNNLTDRLIAIARSLPQDGMLKMHQQPFVTANYQEPKIRGIDTDKIILSQAYYDSKQKALIVTINPIYNKGTTEVEIYQLDSALSWQVFINNHWQKTISDRSRFSLTVL